MTIMTENDAKRILGQKRRLSTRFKVLVIAKPVLQQNDRKRIFGKNVVLEPYVD